MDPQTQSLLTSIGLGLAMSAAGWAVSQGVIPQGDQSALANQLVLVAGGLIAAGFAWWKRRQQSQAALAKAITPETAIAKINAEPNGLKVVSVTGPGQTVSAPVASSK